ncbi:putative anti-sigma factor [Pedobacter sp. BAL39]|uniref:FecR family protein n=1 Tax=Pedobacter sp. BAL39 TaxID=391596 RepID=UPI000155AD62|nr:FecR domain-containing protein [Pedobacter sp. BAL39]EDM34733.1 putative anti-sigma factor [Pedobacter sp. BAL39]
MNADEVMHLIQRYTDHTASAEEIALLESWYAERAAGGEQPLFSAEGEETDRLLADRFLAMKSRSLADIMSIPIPQKTIQMQPRKSYARWAVVAASLFFTFFSGLYFYRELIQDPLAEVHIAPADAETVLTLGDGRQILLEEASTGGLAKEAGITVTKNAEGTLVYKAAGAGAASTYHTVETHKGGGQVLVLQDGSKVYLNASSSLKFPPTFAAKGKRRVELMGEAYFEVAKDPAHPFMVSSKGQELQVLGTHFNLSAYPEDGAVKTTLLEGSVEVFPIGDAQGKAGFGQGRKGLLLKPGQQSVVTSSAAQLVNANVEEAVAWKNGYFRFNDEPIESVMKKIARWYDIEVDYAGAPTNEGLSGTISRFTDISDVLRMLEKTKVVHFKVEGRRVTVMK